MKEGKHEGGYYYKIDITVVYMENLINIIMGILFVTRIIGLPEIDHILGLIAMTMGFALGYIAFFAI